MTYISNVTRSPGDPRIVSSGPSSLATTDQLGRFLGWFSIGLGLMQLLAPRRVTRTLGMEGSEGLIRAYGAREIASGILTLGVEKQVGLWSRVAGDGLDLATLAPAIQSGNPKRGNAGLALAMVIGVSLLDLATAQDVTVRHGRWRDNSRRYRDRTGFPRGIEKVRSAARDAKMRV